ncbi:MAG TPA: hypothetical protein VFW98_12770 [Gemmatimonadaceae bacterium]|nr:hypothetical protein [Gemmatimonadaceae bacterium]
MIRIHLVPRLPRRSRAATVLAFFAALAVLGASTRTAHAQQPATPASGAALLRRMHDAYAGRWFRTLTFTQRTTIRAGDSTSVSTWYEALLSPDRLRIDIGNPSAGNGVLSTADSTYVVRAGTVTRTAANGNPFIPFVAGVYTQPVNVTLRQVAPYHFALDRVRRATWQDRPVFVVGAREASDTTSPQFWVDAERLVLVRMILSRGAPPHTQRMDIHLDHYVPVGGGRLATKVTMYEGGVARQTEEYRGWRAGMALPAALFDATKWSSVPHWTQMAPTGPRDSTGRGSR